MTEDLRISPDRSAARAAVIARAGFAGALVQPLAMDASTRRYERLVDGPRTAILMDAPRANEAPPCAPTMAEADRLALGWNATARLAASRVEAFVAVAGYLRSLGLSAPEVLAEDSLAGYAVVEDLGPALFAHAIPDGADEATLYRAAAAVLAKAQATVPPAHLDGPEGGWPLLTYDALALRANADLFVDWLPRFHAELALSDADRVRWEGVRDRLIEQADGFARAFTIRDFHAENLIWLPERDGVAKVGLLDFQDAVLGWRSWDFTMLLQDARRDVSPAAAEGAIATYLDLTGAAEAPFRQEFAVLGALNALRILGLFCRLVARDGKPRYQSFMPREWGHLAANLDHPALSELRGWLDDVNAPYARRAA